MALPASKDRLGYTEQEILGICRDRKIDPRTFWKAFGVNTVAVGSDGTSRFYTCDVEVALYRLDAKDGKFHPWD